MCHCAFCHTLKVIVCLEGHATSLLRPDQRHQLCLEVVPWVINNFRCMSSRLAKSRAKWHSLFSIVAKNVFSVFYSEPKKTLKTAVFILSDMKNVKKRPDFIRIKKIPWFATTNMQYVSLLTKPTVAQLMKLNWKGPQSFNVITN